jgi:hypothetical protein
MQPSKRRNEIRTVSNRSYKTSKIKFIGSIKAKEGYLHQKLRSANMTTI